TIARLAIFVVEGLIISSLSAGLRMARRRAERLVVLEQAARAEAERSAQRLRDLQRVTDTALANLKLDELLRELIGRVREVLDADTVVILLLTDDGREVAVRAALGLEEEVTEGIRIPVGQGIAGRIVAQAGPLVFDDLDHQEIAATEGRFEGEAWRVRRDGSRFWADVVVTALRDGDGRLVGYAVVTHDLTERKRSAEVRARLLDQVIAAQEDEQRRIARELHD